MNRLNSQFFVSVKKWRLELHNWISGLARTAKITNLNLHLSSLEGRWWCEAYTQYLWNHSEGDKTLSDELFVCFCTPWLHWVSSRASFLRDKSAWTCSCAFVTTTVCWLFITPAITVLSFVLQSSCSCASASLPIWSTCSTTAASWWWKKQSMSDLEHSSKTHEHFDGLRTDQSHWCYYWLIHSRHQGYGFRF